MSSTYTHPEHLDRKALKKPDGFMMALSHFFEKMAKNPRRLGILAGVLVVLLIAGSIFASQQNTRSAEARNALFLAEKSIEMELKALAPKTVTAVDASPAVTGRDAPAEAAAAKEKARAKAKDENAALEAVLYQKLDVNARFPESIAKLKAVSEKYHGTRPAYEAQLVLGRLYSDHGDSVNALPWLVRALGSAPSPSERIMTGLAVGHTQEDLGKYPEAIQDYEATAKIAEGTFKGDALLSMARTFELMHDSVKARAVYDQIISTLAGTEYAKTAELQKSQIE